jgi:hypothetical protein
LAAGSGNANIENDCSKRFDGIQRPDDGESQAAINVKSDIGRI